MKYFAKITKQSPKNYLVEFPELNGCFTEGESLSHAKEMASEALHGWLSSHCDRDLNIPYPKNRKTRYYYPIEIDLALSFAIILRRYRKEYGWTQGQVAKKLKISQQAYAKLESPDKANPTLSTIQKISKVLGLEVLEDLAA